MQRRTFLASAAVLPAAFVQAQEQITHVDTKSSGPALKSAVVKGDSLPEEGNSPGAKARVHFNGPTKQLKAVATGMVTLQPGAQPHPPHRHLEEEFVIIASGTGECVVDGVVSQVQAGDVMYAEANVLHGVKNTGSAVMVFYFTKILA
ncbi:cupin domain-containing protein [Silvibacterium acidisoli]|uniref:cupin domain-containing protein n=1 Tax=Acidobacteriaceae bacterium ZG23-2 TaxID=2883246 RepID=UPI00406CF8C3